MSEIEVAVLSRKVADLEAQLASLRRGMIGQLSATGRLTKVLFDLDDQRFGGRFQRDATEGRSPAQDLALAERILEALSTATTAPASPIDDGEAHTLRLRAETAELARAEAERALAAIADSQRSTSAAVEAELAAHRAELASLQAQVLAERQAQSGQVTDLTRLVAQVREALACEQDLRHSDLAEARSLAAEVERLAASDPAARGGDDLEVNLAVLHDVLEARTGIDAVNSAAEAVLVDWSRSLTARAVSAAQELSTVRWQLEEARTRLGQLQPAHDHLAREAARRLELDAADAAARTAMTHELSGLRHDLARSEEARAVIQRDLAARESELVEARALAERLRSEGAAAIADRQRLTDALRTSETTSRDTVARLQDIVDRARQTTQEAERTAADARAQLAGAKDDENRARARAEAAERDLAQARTAVELVTGEADLTRRNAAAETQRLSAKSEALERALGEAQAALTASREAERGLRDQLATTAARATSAEEATRATNAALAAEREQRAALATERDRLHEAVTSERRRTEHETIEAKDRVAAAIQSQATLTAERDRLRADLAALQGQLDGLQGELPRQAQEAGARVAEADRRRAEAEATVRRLEAHIAELEAAAAHQGAASSSAADHTARLSAATRDLATQIARAEAAEADLARTRDQLQIAADNARAEARHEFDALLKAARAALLKAKAAPG